MSETTAPRPPAGRYGPVPGAHRRALARAGMAALGAVAVAGAVWVGVGAGSAPVRWDDVGYVVQGPDRVEVTFRVTKDPDTTATCTITALNQSYAEVGVVTMTAGAAPERVVEHTVTVATQELAVTGVVDRCEVVRP